MATEGLVLPRCDAEQPWVLQAVDLEVGRGRWRVVALAVATRGTQPGRVRVCTSGETFPRSEIGGCRAG